MRTRTVLLLVVLMGLGGAALFFASRGLTTTIAGHVGPQQIEAECTGWTGVSDGCGAWGSEVLTGGAPSNTFEVEDVVRIRLDRPLLGLASTCVAEYFLGRYPDEVAWTEDVPCPDG